MSNENLKSLNEKLLEKTKEKLEKFSQQHLLKYYDELGDAQKEKLLLEIDGIDFSLIEKTLNEKNLEENKSNSKNNNESGNEISPIKKLSLEEIKKDEVKYKEIGSKLIKEGKVGLILLAGGQGSRLGVDKSKGLVNIGVTKELYIFELQIMNMLKIVKEVNGFFSLYIMTSEINDEAIRSFLKEKNYFGFDKNFVKFFIQDKLPTTDFEGKVNLLSKSEISFAPDGNGNLFKTFYKNFKDDFNSLEYIEVVGIDNILQIPIDPVFIGATEVLGYSSASKVIKKIDPAENVGILCLKNDHPSVIEYYELNDEPRHMRDENNDLVYNAGLILNYLFKVKELAKIIDKDLPLHLAKKKIKSVNESGETITPDTENGYKYESLLLDLVEKMEDCLPFFVDRDVEFSPIKNKSGESSIESAREDLKRNGYEI